ncbi:MAG: UDP-N-acetylmuramoyl-tripeptide--D-alanyl-D-alanine ligase [Oscillospiraceae bacterium]|nr:UDP-N-acetylmuramoyl-tripeptide--D-alanyl-D-alanine ligase [Oscillospiraceae bacterium]
MAMLQQINDLRMQAAEIARVLNAKLQNCADASFFVSRFSTDTRTIEAGNCFIALSGENFNGNHYAKTAAERGASLCILTEEPQEDLGIPYLVTEDSVKAYGDLARYHMANRKVGGLRVVGVTGSSGKTTVKDMTAHVLAAKYRTYATSGNHNNHIGVPYTILHMPEDAEVAVVEMGMNHAGEIRYLTKIAAPDAAIITNIGTAHIGNLGSQENILKAKLEILEGMEQGTLIVPADDPLLLGKHDDLAKISDVRYITRMQAEAAGLSAENIVETADDTRFTMICGTERVEAYLPMTGLHNVTDALLAVQAGMTCGMTLAECAAALADFVPGAMRSERVKIGNITIIRDYYNANPEAMAAALQSFGTIAGNAEKWALLGNMNELGEYASARHRELGALCRQYADRAYFCGVNYNDFAEGYGDAAAAFETQEQLMDVLRDVLRFDAQKPMCFLIKGSRGLHMERVNTMLEALIQEK